MMDEQLFIWQHRNDNVKALSLQSQRYPEIDMPYALDQIAGWQVATNKIPSWAENDGIIYPKHLSMEQCSSEITANYKATLLEGKSFADLTGGFGVDCFFLSHKFDQATYVERQAYLCDIAKHNYSQLHRNIHVENAEFDAYIDRMNHVDWFFLDPARRDSTGGKVVAISNCEPDVKANLPKLLNKANKILLKLSPMLDLSQAITDLDNHVEQAHIISVDNECKELVLVIGQKQHDNIPIFCVNLRKHETQSFVFCQTDEVSACPTYTDNIEQYLYEPNVSILKAGCYKTLAQKFNLKKLHPNSHLYTSNTFVEDFPGRTFKVIQTVGFSKKELREGLKDIQKANITIRNFPSSVDALRKRLKLKDGGNKYIFATTINNDKKVLVLCQ